MVGKRKREDNRNGTENRRDNIKIKVNNTKAKTTQLRTIYARDEMSFMFRGFPFHLSYCLPLDCFSL